MGQIVNVVERPSARPGIVRFETNRALSGTGHDRYVAGQVIDDVRPTDELARRIFARGGINAVHINGSVITVDLEKGYDAAGIADIVRGLYTFYLDGGEELAPDDPRAAVAARNEELQAQFEAAEAAAAAAKAEEEAKAPAEEPPTEAPAAEEPPTEAPAAEEPTTEGPAAEAPAAEEVPPGTAVGAEGHGEVAVEPAEVPNEAEGTVQPADAEVTEAPDAEAPAADAPTDTEADPAAEAPVVEVPADAAADAADEAEPVPEATDAADAVDAADEADPPAAPPAE